MYRRILLAMAIIALSACATLPTEINEPPLSEQLKQKISKARNAIIETQEAIRKAQGTPYLEELTIRLAELLSDEAKAHYQVARARDGESKEVQAPQVKTLKQQAVALYQKFIKSYPHSPLLARAYFNQGQEYRELGDYDQMRKVFVTLTTQFPKDPLSAEAHLVLGNDYFDRASLTEAKTAYQSILEFPLGHLQGIALYKLAWVAVNEGDCALAVKSFEQSILKTESYLALPSQPKLSPDLDIRRDAIGDMIYCFSKEKSQEGAVDYLRTLAYDRGPLIYALEKLGARYQILDQPKGQRDVSRALLKYAPDHPKRLEDAQVLYHSLKVLKDYTHVGEDATLIAQLIGRVLSNPQILEAERKRLGDEFERYVRDLAVSAQEEYQQMLRNQKSIPADLITQIQTAYIAYLNHFPTAENRDDLLSNLAGLYAKNQQYYQAGRRYLELFELRKANQKDGTVESAYDTLVFFQKSIDQQNQERIQRVIARAGLRKAGTYLLKTTLDAEQSRKVKFAIAQTFYDEGKLDDATEYLTAVALEFPKSQEGDVASYLLLDAYQKNSDFAGLNEAGKRLLNAQISDQLRTDLKPILEESAQRQLDELALEASGIDGGDSSAELEKFAMEASKSGNVELGERALLNAFISAKAEAKIDDLYRIADALVQQYPKSTQLGNVMASVARTATQYLDLNRALPAFQQASLLDKAQKPALLLALAQIKSMIALNDEAALHLKESIESGANALMDESIGRYADLLIQTKSVSDAYATLNQLKVEQKPAELSAYLAYLLVAQDKYDEAEEILQPALEIGEALKASAFPISLYTQAEIYYHMLKDFQPGASVDELGEWVTMLELAEQGYLKAVRTGSTIWSAAALGRLADLDQFASTKIASFQAPSELSEGEKTRFLNGFKKRSEELKKQSAQALNACQEQGLKRASFSPTVLQCLQGQIPNRFAVSFTQPLKRQATTDVSIGQNHRKALFSQPSDLKAAMGLADILITQNDPHLAKVALSQVLSSGGAEVANLYGIACAKMQDWACALDGFSRAGIGGLEAGVQNLVKLLGQLGVSSNLAEIQKNWKITQAGGRLWEGQ